MTTYRESSVPDGDRVPQETVTAFIRIARVKELSGFSKSTLLRWIKAGKFPAPVIKESSTVLWDLSECQRWRVEQFKKRDERLKSEGGTEKRPPEVV